MKGTMKRIMRSGPLNALVLVVGVASAQQPQPHPHGRVGRLARPHQTGR
jgi:hypothetical protein